MDVVPTASRTTRMATRSRTAEIPVIRSAMSADARASAWRSNPMRP